LNAGAVAVRTYAVGYVNFPRGADHDICSTTSCQVYNPNVSSSFTDRAVDFTAGCVMINANNAITRGLTEYSAENNQLGMACGDGYTASVGGCLADPVCIGESEFGHGRGLCQWGSARWATGLKFPNRSLSDNTTTNGHPRQDWQWILNHYYPNLRLVRTTPLALNNPVRVIGSSSPLNVRACPGGTITNGVNCPSIGTRPLGAIGYITGGPQRVMADGQGYTWWRVRWQNGIEGWSVENYLDRFIPTNTAPAFTPVADLTLHAGMALRMTNTASDADFPPNTLTFSLPTAPPAAAIHPSTGYLLWTMTATNVGTTNFFTVRVTDNGSPALSATNSFRVRIIPPPQVSAASVPANSVRLTWTSAPRSRYRVEYANNLSSPSWLPLGNIITGTASTTSFTDALAQQRFYRILVVD
ncbi:MAG TPA: SpoIID/LytB domain-containing protein, partial [Lacipirellulaceae bacterium]|nr:SpoIID/LytB domain-containing protein [Lacipirellulaceae bacterium]